MNQVDFEIFQGSVKRFGYKIDLNDEHMKKISPDIKLSFEEMQANPNSVYAQVYKDEVMFFKDKRHNVPKLLRLGFLLCRHYSPESQSLELWHMVNPKLEETISKNIVENLLKDLTYVAVDMNYSKLL